VRVARDAVLQQMPAAAAVGLRGSAPVEARALAGPAMAAISATVIPAASTILLASAIHTKSRVLSSCG
jgi:hypothetical protein